MAPPRLTWDFGTVYDFFTSLYVLHKPADFGLRGVWAAGMRSRLPAAEREFLEQYVGQVELGPPLHWCSQLPAPKSAEIALRELERIPVGERLVRAILPGYRVGEAEAVLLKTMETGQFDERDVEALYAAFRETREDIHAPSRKKVAAILDTWTRPVEFGERYLRALRAYFEAFFAEEERRIYPALQQAYRDAAALAETMPIAELFEELSHGISMEMVEKMDELIFAPSYWAAPLVFLYQLPDNRMLVLFGARPPEASLIPGEVIPEGLLRALKALSDPTRLKILHYLAAESLTPTQLAHRLRLRAPTVVHHLKTLRLAGLVHMTLAEGKERSYAMRRDSLDETCETLQSFLREAEPLDASGRVER